MADQPKRPKRTDVPEETERVEDESTASTATEIVPSPADEIDELRKERDNLQDRLLRQAAEFDNYRKRIDRERRDSALYASVDLYRISCR